MTGVSVTWLTMNLGRGGGEDLANFELREEENESSVHDMAHHELGEGGGEECPIFG